MMHAWRVLYHHRDIGYVVADSHAAALKLARASAEPHRDKKFLQVEPDLRHPDVRKHYGIK
jgi:hypothetical protein